MAAFALTKKGKKVYLISRSDSWGGSWHYVKYGSEFVDTSCHLLESYKIVHDILKALEINMYPLTKKSAPIRLDMRLKHYKKNIALYHSRNRIFREFIYKNARLVKALGSAVLSPRKCNFKNILTILSDLKLFIYHRLSQLLVLEPIHFPKAGWPGFVREITDKLIESSADIINDSVTSINCYDNTVVVNTADGSTIKGDMLLAGQSTILESSRLLGNAKGLIFQKAYKNSYPHILVEICGLSANLELPYYIHLPADENIHRITLSFASRQGNHCFLVQIREGDDLDLESILELVLERVNIVATAYSNHLHDYSLSSDKLYYPENVSIKLLARYDPKAADLDLGRNIKPTICNNILILRTIGDLSRNMAYYQRIFC